MEPEFFEILFLLDREGRQIANLSLPVISMRMKKPSLTSSSRYRILKNQKEKNRTRTTRTNQFFLRNTLHFALRFPEFLQFGEIFIKNEDFREANGRHFG